MSTRDEPAEPGVETLKLIGDHALEVRRGPESSVLRIVAPDGKLGISIAITREGMKLSLEGANVELSTSGSLAIRADELSLHGERGISMTTSGDAAIRAAGDLRSEARIQTIEAKLGNVNVKANDDVCLDGERVRLNCPDPRLAGGRRP
ncbi:MAG: hypothetical protein HUU21_36070 [Polyangiaceae bacterium]|nr:hypothetical protein [Polyangiaceae bacterium]NUQ78973.1 hypothetical protein [Polyangiaceae bacterium]